MQFLIIIFICVPLRCGGYLDGIDKAILCMVGTIPEIVCWFCMPIAALGILVGAIGLNAYEDSFWTGEMFFSIFCLSIATFSYIVRVYGG